jgi:glucosamine--fructose-6-phosphate aminotransferase (isomerizing)
MEKLKALQSDTLVISSEPSVLKLARRQIRFPRTIDEILSPIPYIIPAQIFAALLAEARGLDPDKPRSLAKVTQTI